MEQDTGFSDPEAAVRAAKEFLQSVLFEDGLAAAVDAAECPTLLPGTDPIVRQLLVMELLQASLYERLKDTDPFDEEAIDDYWSPLPYGGSAALNCALTADTDPGRRKAAGSERTPTKPGIAQARRYERTAVTAHRVMQSCGAVRTLAAARFARFEEVAGTPEMAAADYVEHPAGHRARYADEFLGAALGLGPHQAARLVDDAVWMRDRTPDLLDQVAHQGAECGAMPGSPMTAAAARRARCRPEHSPVPINLDVVATIARELQDARPDTCATVQSAVLRRGIHRTTAAQARRSARTLVTKHEASAARTTAKKTAAQQQNVWADPYSTPGLAMLTAIMPTEQVEALYAAVEELAHRLQANSASSGGAEKTLGQHRVDALFQLAMRGVTLRINLDIITADPEPGQHAGTTTGGGDNGDGPNPAADHRTEGDRRSAKRNAFTPDPLRALAGAVAFGHTGAMSVAGLTELAEQFATGKVRSRATHRSVSDLTADLPTEAERATTRYRPTQTLRQRVIARDRTCRHPGCNRPGRYTDLDHLVPWPRGSTSLANLHCLCRRHHRAKHARWKVITDGRGNETWTSPTGRIHTTSPGTLTDLIDAGFPCPN